jgi:hypothetical protein
VVVRTAAFHGRKNRKATVAYCLTDCQRLPLAISEPVSANRNDIYDIEVQFEVVTATLEEADITVDGPFLNAGAGFDSKSSEGHAAKRRSTATYVSTNATGTAIGTSTSTKNCTTTLCSRRHQCLDGQLPLAARPLRHNDT